MARKPMRQPPETAAARSPTPIREMMSSRLIVLANLLSRGAILRYKRVAGLSSTEFGLVAALGERPPMSVAALADAMGRDKAQISRALAGLVSRKFIARSGNPDDSREILVSLTMAGLAAHEKIVASALERNQQLVEKLGSDEVRKLLEQIDHLTENATGMLETEKQR